MTKPTAPSRPPIAVVGASALFPGSVDATGFWKDILAGSDLITGVPASHWLVEDYYDPDPAVPDKTYANRGGFLPEIDFDALGWGVPPIDSCRPPTPVAAARRSSSPRSVLEDALRAQGGWRHDEARSIGGSRSSSASPPAQELLATMVSRLAAPRLGRSRLRDSRHRGETRSKRSASASLRNTTSPWQRELLSPAYSATSSPVASPTASTSAGTNCVTDAACASRLSRRLRPRASASCSWADSDHGDHRRRRHASTTSSCSCVSARPPR